MIIITAQSKIFMLITDTNEIPKKPKQSIVVKKPTKAENNIFPVIIVLEKKNDKLVLQIPKEKTEKVLEFYIGHYAIRDIGIEEEEIGSVVERIYKGV